MYNVSRGQFSVIFRPVGFFSLHFCLSSGHFGAHFRHWRTFQSYFNHSMGQLCILLTWRALYHTFLPHKRAFYGVFPWRRALKCTFLPPRKTHSCLSESGGQFSVVSQSGGALECIFASKEGTLARVSQQLGHIASLPPADAHHCSNVKITSNLNAEHWCNRLSPPPQKVFLKPNKSDLIRLECLLRGQQVLLLLPQQSRLGIIKPSVRVGLVFLYMRVTKGAERLGTFGRAHSAARASAHIWRRTEKTRSVTGRDILIAATHRHETSYVTWE